MGSVMPSTADGPDWCRNLTISFVLGGFLEHWLNWRNRPHIIHTKHSEPCTVTPKLFFYNFSYHFILGFEPKSVELHQTSTFEGRSTDWAMAPRQLRKIIKHLHFCLGRHIRSHPSCQEGPRFPKVDAARCFAALDDTDSEQVGFFFVVQACHLLVLDGFDQLLSLALSTLSKQCSCQ